MKLLLETHALIWFADAPEKLSSSAYEAISDESHRVYISMVCVWEMQIKQQLGKLALDLPLPALIKAQKTTNDMAVLPIRFPHIYGLSDLPPHHKDPFDRLLIAQARAEQLTLVTTDGMMQAYRDLVDLYW